VNVPKRNFITRKEIAQVLEVTPQTIMRQEQKLGLDKARCIVQVGRSIYYNAELAERELRNRRLWPCPT